MTSVVLRDIELKDLDEYTFWNHPSREFHKWNGPYFSHETEEELQLRVQKIKKCILAKKNSALGKKKLITNSMSDEIIGEVNWYWRSKETMWIEVGIIIFNEKYWGKGIGSVALPLWINELFAKFPALVRIGLSTWSGNARMMRLAEKIGLQKEAVYKKARIVDGKYFDSVSYGILKEEWEKL